MNAMPLTQKPSMAVDYDPGALADIYRPEVTMAIWQRQLSADVSQYASHVMATSAHWQTRFIQQPQNIAQQLERELPLSDHRAIFINDVVQAVDMFSCLFELEHVGLRMAVLSKAMCPKYHVDRVPCRLICTYAGAGTQWHPTEHVDRSTSGAINPQSNVLAQNLSPGDIALLKGEAWEGNEGRGLVHRSPAATPNTPRLVLTLDFA